MPPTSLNPSADPRPRNTGVPPVRTARRSSKLLSILYPLSSILFLLNGCGPSAQQIQTSKAITAFDSGDYGYARQTLRPLAEKKDENFVLNNCRLGHACLA